MPEIRPRDAATVILIRENPARELCVLMGRRSRRAAFAPDVFVFPGGRAEADDDALEPLAGLRPGELEKLRRFGAAPPRIARRLATAAVRETWEETGYLIGSSATDGETLCPDHSALRFVARAITPRESPIRFHARFFLARGEDLTGDPAGSGELTDLAWYPLHEARRLPAFDITEFILAEAARFAAGPAPLALFTYRNGKASIRWTQDS